MAKSAVLSSRPDSLAVLEQRNAELAAEVERLRQQLAAAGRAATATQAEHDQAQASSRDSLAIARADNADLRAANTELTADRDEARAGEHRLAMVLDSAVDHAIITLDLEGRITGWNPGAQNIMGWSPDEVVGQLGHIIFTPEDRAAGAPEEELAGALAEGVAVDERWHLKKDGTRFWASGLMMQLRNGKLEGFLKILRDRTGQHEAEEALRHQSEVTRTIAENAADAMFLMDEAGCTNFANPAAERIFGWSPSELLGKKLHDVVHYQRPNGEPLPVHDCALVQVFSTGQTLSHHEDIFYCKDGSAVPVSCSNAPIIRNGRVVGAALIVRDITERRRAEEHRMLLINELNHRVKNTLAIVQGIAHQTFRGKGSDNEQRQLFEARLGALSSAHNILTRENWEHAQLAEIVDGALAPFVRLRGDRIAIVGDDAPLPPKTAVSLSMALHELATNAVKYGALSTDAGSVSVKWHISTGEMGARLRFAWREEGGPPVEPPQQRGFGSRLIERGLASELQGKVEMHFDRSGVACLIDALLPTLVAPEPSLAH